MCNQRYDQTMSGTGNVGLHGAETSRAVPVPTLAKVYEDHAEDCTRAAERTDDPLFRKMLLMLALQWRLAAQEEASKQIESSDITQA
jgi:hypothetical protein